MIGGTFDDSKIKESNERLESKLINDKKLWGGRIMELISKLKNVDTLSDCQIEMLSYRQMLTDEIVELRATIYKRNGSWDKLFKELYRNYSINYDIKLSATEKSNFIKSDLSSLKIQIQLLETYVSYFQDCIKTLDNLAFAIRNRIRLSEED